MQIGDTVTWESQSGGHTTTKVGPIVKVLEPKRYYSRADLARGTNLNMRHFEHGLWRNEVSYLVNVNGVAYCPRTKWLRKVEEQPCPKCAGLRAAVRACVLALYAGRDVDECWYTSGRGDDDWGDCANWPVGPDKGCRPECPIVRLRELAGIQGQDDGNAPKE